ncbi:hypothetical protein D3C81_1071530 [compost metagenome]
MLVNMSYMPQEDNKLLDIRRNVDKLLSVIFGHIAESLRDPYHLWDGKELIEAGKLVDQGLASAKRALENQMISPNETWSIYFFMRKEQLDRVETMMELISLVYQRMPQGEYVAMLFDRLSQDVVSEEYTGQTEIMLHELEQEFKMMELPSSREEFELRSAILQLCRELANYLYIAKKAKAPATVKSRWKLGRD